LEGHCPGRTLALRAAWNLQRWNTILVAAIASLGPVPGQEARQRNRAFMDNIKLFELAGKLLERFPLALLLAGCFGIVLGANAGLPFLGITITEPKWRYMIAFCAIALIITSIAFAAKESQSSSQKLINPNKYKVIVEDPVGHANVEPPLVVKGRIEKSPPPYVDFWLFTMRGLGSDVPCEPHNRLTIGEDRRWKAELNPRGWKPGDRSRIAVFAVGRDGQALIRFYYRVKDNYLDSSGYLPSLEAITSDIVRLSDIVEVKLGNNK
jgi:hypothetical protein